MPALTLVIYCFSKTALFESPWLRDFSGQSAAAKRAVTRFARRAQLRDLCNVRILDRRGAACAAPDNSGRLKSAGHAAHHARDAFRGAISNGDVLDLA